MKAKQGLWLQCVPASVAGKNARGRKMTTTNLFAIQIRPRVMGF
jgi:hypothetical protein